MMLYIYDKKLYIIIATKSSSAMYPSLRLILCFTFLILKKIEKANPTSHSKVIISDASNIPEVPLSTTG